MIKHKIIGSFCNVLLIFFVSVVVKGNNLLNTPSNGFTWIYQTIMGCENIRILPVFNHYISFCHFLVEPNSYRINLLSPSRPVWLFGG